MSLTRVSLSVWPSERASERACPAAGWMGGWASHYCSHRCRHCSASHRQRAAPALRGELAHESRKPRRRPQQTPQSEPLPAPLSGVPAAGRRSTNRSMNAWFPFAVRGPCSKRPPAPPRLAAPPSDWVENSILSHRPSHCLQRHCVSLGESTRPRAALADAQYRGLSSLYNGSS